MLEARETFGNSERAPLRPDGRAEEREAFASMSTAVMFSNRNDTCRKSYTLVENQSQPGSSLLPKDRRRSLVGGSEGQSAAGTASCCRRGRGTAKRSSAPSRPAAARTCGEDKDWLADRSTAARQWREKQVQVSVDESILRWV